MQGFDIAGRSIYCDETGGDYFDYLTVAKENNGGIGIVVGDVSGHGIESALLMTTLRAFLRQRSSMEGRISDIVSDVNREITRDIGDSGHFITLIYIRIDKKEKELHWVCAGHDPGIIYDSNSNIFSELFNHGVPLGIDDNIEYPESGLMIRSGQVILLGTDGLWETHNDQRDMFGKEKLKGIIRDNADKPAIEIIDTIIDEIKDFRSSKKQEDDITLVVIKVE
jgi:sigma-B regulation protein RsbU (phosphoserine phosphatase)